MPYKPRIYLSASAGVMLSKFSFIAITPIYVDIIRPDVYFVNVITPYVEDINELWAQKKARHNLYRAFKNRGLESIQSPHMLVQ